VAFRNLSGLKLGRLTVGAYISKSADGSDRLWACTCSCQGENAVPFPVRAKSLVKSNGTRSCGCIQKERASVANKTHGFTKSITYVTWGAMWSRTTNPNQKSYKDYATRKIRVCPRWKRFENFLADMGPRPSPKHTIERVDNNLGYAPKNCRWATRKEQNRNTRATRWITIGKETLSLAEWCERFNQPRSRIEMRLRRGWSIVRAFQTRAKSELVYVKGSI